MESRFLCLAGRLLVSYGASKKHCSFYSMDPKVLEAYLEELSGFETSKGTVRSQPEEPLPDACVKKMVLSRVSDIREHTRSPVAHTSGTAAGQIITTRQPTQKFCIQSPDSKSKSLPRLPMPPFEEPLIARFRWKLTAISRRSKILAAASRTSEDPLAGAI